VARKSDFFFSTLPFRGFGVGTKVWKSLKLWVQAMPKEGMGFVFN